MVTLEYLFEHTNGTKCLIFHLGKEKRFDGLYEHDYVLVELCIDDYAKLELLKNIANNQYITTHRFKAKVYVTNINNENNNIGEPPIEMYFDPMDIENIEF